MSFTTPAGLIFLSHASADKDYVEDIRIKLPQSHIFYDIKTIDPAQSTIEAMKEGISKANVFVYFVSPNTEKAVWEKYEAALAEVEAAKRDDLSILVVPIKGATFRDSPEWMHRYMAFPKNFRQTDLVRRISFLYEASLRAKGKLRRDFFVGREDIKHSISIDVWTQQTKSGVPINFLIMSGIENMGRQTLAQHVVPEVFPSIRLDGPVFSLPPHADAVDVYMALRQDAEGTMSRQTMEGVITAFNDLPSSDKAKCIGNYLEHYGEINQVVTIRSAFGLRDFSPELKDWVLDLFVNLRNQANTKVIWVSERSLDEKVINEFPNVAQFRVPEISDASITYLLTKLLDPRDASVAPISALAPVLQGHVGSAHHAARLIEKGGRSPESLLENHQEIQAYQDRSLARIFSSDLLDPVEKDILSVLSFLPSSDYKLISKALEPHRKQKISDALLSLYDSCLISYAVNSGYRMPEFVRAVYRRHSQVTPLEILKRISRELEERLRGDKLDMASVESLLFIHAAIEGDIPSDLLSILTPAFLHEIVERNYMSGLGLGKEYRSHFEVCSKLSLLSAKMKMANDTREHILFHGAEASVRLGKRPDDIIDIMKKYNYGSAYYVLGSYYYYNERKYKDAEKNLLLALKAKKFTTRTSRLLARMYLNENEPFKALEILDRLGERRVSRESGLLAIKIKCLRALGRRKEADDLVHALKALGDEFGEYELFAAASAMKEGNYRKVKEYLAAAKEKPKANRINISLLECAASIDSGNFETVDEVCTMAAGLGRQDDAHHLRARAAFQAGNWSDAEALLKKIKMINFYDVQLYIKVLSRKLEDKLVQAKPEVVNDTKKMLEEMLVKSRQTIDNFER